MALSRFRCGALSGGPLRAGVTLLLAAALLVAAERSAPCQRTFDPRFVATLFIDGIDGDGPDQTGVFGVDIQNDLVDEIAVMMGVPTGLTRACLTMPLALN